MEKLLHEIPAIIGRHVDAAQYRVFLFGSRATGRARAHSDIDVGIEGPAPIPWETLSRIKGDIEELPTLYTIEVVDFQRVSSGFKRVATERKKYLQPF